MSNDPQFMPPQSPAGFQPYPAGAHSVQPPGQRQYSMLAAMFLAPFFHTGVYRDVARNWRGINFWYLFLLLLVSWMLLMIKFHFAVGHFARNDFPPLVKNFPAITINAGHVTSPVAQPYVMEDPQSHKAFAVLDTTGKIKSMDDTNAMILLTDHKLWTRNQNDIRQYDLSQIKYFYLDKAKLIGWMNQISQFLAIGLFPLALIFALIGRLIQALIYGAINMGFSSGFRANLTYAAAMRLAVLSVTPVIMIGTITGLGGWTIPGWPLLGIALSLLYMVLAVRANGDSLPRPPGHGFPVMPAPAGFGQSQQQYQPVPPYQPPSSYQPPLAPPRT